MVHPIHRALQLHQQGNLSEAEVLYRQIIDAEPMNADALNLLGVLCAQQGKPGDAEEFLRRAVDLRPDNAGYNINLGSVLRATGKKAEAAAAWQRAAELSPDDPDAWCNLGVLRIESGDEPGAEEAWRRSIGLSPQHANALTLLGTLLHRRGQTDAAELCYQQALMTDPQHPQARPNMAQLRREEAVAALQRGDAAAAIPRLKQASDLDPTDLQGWMLLGGVLQQVGRLKEAFQALEQALMLDPNRPEIHHNIGNLFKESGQIAQAIAAYRHALSLGSVHPATRLALQALTGESPSASPPEVVRDLFDGYAARFDEHLTGDLEYQTPQRLADLVDAADPGRRWPTMLDLGCGTGLSAAALAGRYNVGVGVDLSSKMLAVAAEKGLYAALYQGEILAFLAQDQQRYPLILAADVLVYFGDLDPLFAAVDAHLEPGGLFAFSVEALDGAEGEWRMLPSERFAHSREYIEKVAAAHGLQAAASEDAPLRKDEAGWIQGHLFVLRKV